MERCRRCVQRRRWMPLREATIRRIGSWTEGRSNPRAGSEAGQGRGGRAAALEDFAEVDGREFRGDRIINGMLELAF
jgi:hypothetical protein